MTQTKTRSRKAKALSASDAKLQKLLDQEMQQFFDQLQDESDSTEPWRDWDNESREIFYQWCMEIDTLTATERLKVDLWKALTKF